jgi:superfamily II DNA helicase RecQ
MIPEYKRDAKEDYLYILKALEEIPFSVGRNLLIDFLLGNEKNKSIVKNNLFSLKTFNSLNSEKNEIGRIIDNLISNRFIEVNTEVKFMKLLKITQKGLQEINNPVFNEKKLKNNFNHIETKISEQDLIAFRSRFWKNNCSYKKNRIFNKISRSRS